MTFHQFHQLRTTMHSDGHGDNFRPLQPINHRSLRTSINFQVNHFNLFLIANNQNSVDLLSYLINIHYVILSTINTFFSDFFNQNQFEHLCQLRKSICHILYSV